MDSLFIPAPEPTSLPFVPRPFMTKQAFEERVTVILAALNKIGPATGQQITVVTGMDDYTVNNTLRRMTGLRQVRILNGGTSRKRYAVYSKRSVS